MSLHHSPKIITDSLLLCLDAGNIKSYPTSGTAWTDLSGNGNNGTLTGGPTFNSANKGGISFDGVDDHIDIGNIAALGFTTGMFTASCWFYIPSTWSSGSQYPNLFGKGASAGWDTDGWTIYMFRNYGSGTGYTVGFGMRNGATVNTCQVYNMPTNVPINVVATVDATSVKVYINKVLSGTTARTIYPGVTTDSLKIASGPSGIYFPGLVYNAMLHSTALSQQEVYQNYDALKGRFGLT